MDFVFTMCDRAANEDCPAFTGLPLTAHWGLPDPVEDPDPLAFKRTFVAIRERITAFSALPHDQLDRLTLQTNADAIGQL